MCIQTASRPIASMDIDGFLGALTLKKSCTDIKLVLQSISVCDLNPNTIYNKVSPGLHQNFLINFSVYVLNILALYRTGRLYFRRKKRFPSVNHSQQ